MRHLGLTTAMLPVTPGPLITSVRADDGHVFGSTGAPMPFGDWAGDKNTVTPFGMRV